MRYATLLLAVVVVLVDVPAWADFEAGWQAHKRGDYATALKEWRPLAEQGVAHAQNVLGIMYSEGRGVPPDDAQGIRWYRRAAVQGFAPAQHHLGSMYAKGEAVPQNDVQAHLWLSLAAAQGYEPARKDRDVLAKEMPPAQLADAQRLAREWKAKGK